MGHDEKCARSARIAAIVATAVCPRKNRNNQSGQVRTEPFIHDVNQQSTQRFRARQSVCGQPDVSGIHNGVWGRWWRQTGSNRRPEACKATALPTELCPQLDLHPATALNLAAPRQTWWAWEDLNFRPHAYQARALTN